MNKFFVLLVFIVITGCTFKAGPVTGPPVNYCKDMRDGELFSFKTEDVSNAVIRINGTGCFTVIDNNGLERKLCSEHEQYIKCREIPFE